MAHSLLTPTEITRRALMILHQKLNFVTNVHRGYEDRFAKSGAKVGDTFSIRLPNEFTVRTGAALSSQDITESSVSMTVQTQKGVDFTFTSRERTLTIDDFAARYLEPAMSKLAAQLEVDAYNAFMPTVYNVVDNIGSALTFKKALEARKMLTDALAPESQRYMILNTQDQVDIVDALKGLFQDSNAIKEQYKEGSMGRTAGFDWYESTYIPASTTGTAPATTLYLSNGASQTGASIAVDTGTATFKAGDVVTFAGVFSVHPETKVSTGSLKTFVVTADYAGGSGNLQIAPAIVASGAKQNVSNAIADNSAVVKKGGASAVYRPSLAFHKDAFAWGTVDLVMPEGVDFSAREVYDGISMRVVRAYDINNDTFPCRIDVMPAWAAIRPQLACRVLSN